MAWLGQLQHDVVIQICDFGISVCVAASCSARLSQGEQHYLQTLPYRAPEVLLGSPTLHLASDVWSIGCILAELSGGRPPWYGHSASNQLMKIFAFKGTPSGQYWKTLPNYKETLPRWEATKELPVWLRRLGESGAEVFDLCTEMEPVRRITAALASEHIFFDTSFLRLVPPPLGCTSWEGERGPFAMQDGNIGNDLCKWLQGDPWWRAPDGLLARIAENSRKKRKICMTAHETAHKIEANFSLRLRGPLPSQFNAATVEGYCPIRRLEAFCEAWRRVLTPWLVQLGADIAAALESVPQEDLGKNGTFFLATPPTEWFR